MEFESRYIVAEIDEDGVNLTFGWSFRVYPDLADAVDELNDAHAAGLTLHRVYELRARRIVGLRALPIRRQHGA